MVSVISQNFCLFDVSISKSFSYLHFWFFPKQSLTVFDTFYMNLKLICVFSI